MDEFGRMDGTMGDFILVTEPRVVGVGEIVSWPEYRRATLRRPEPIEFVASAGDVVRFTRIIDVRSKAEPNNRAARRMAMSRKRK